MDSDDIRVAGRLRCGGKAIIAWLTYNRGKLWPQIVTISLSSEVGKLSGKQVILINTWGVYVMVDLLPSKVFYSEWQRWIRHLRRLIPCNLEVMNDTSHQIITVVSHKLRTEIQASFCNAFQHKYRINDSNLADMQGYKTHACENYKYVFFSLRNNLYSFLFFGAV